MKMTYKAYIMFLLNTVIDFLLKENKKYQMEKAFKVHGIVLYYIYAT